MSGEAPRPTSATQFTREQYLFIFVIDSRNPQQPYGTTAMQTWLRCPRKYT
jgi:hypothetical protein